MDSLFDLSELVEAETCEPDPDQWSEICAVTRDERPGRAAHNPAADWFARQVADHAGRSREEGDYHDLVATALRDVLLVLRSTGCRTAAELVAHTGTIYRRVDLARVAVPDELRRSPVAELLDEYAAFYLYQDTDLARMAAFVILGHADAAEHHGALTLEDYHAASDAEDALLNAYDAVFGDDGQPR